MLENIIKFYLSERKKKKGQKNIGGEILVYDRRIQDWYVGPMVIGSTCQPHIGFICQVYKILSHYGEVHH